MLQDRKGVPGLRNVATEPGEQVYTAQNRFHRDDTSVPLSILSQS